MGLQMSDEARAGSFLIHVFLILVSLLVPRYDLKIYGENLKIKLTENEWSYFLIEATLE